MGLLAASLIPGALAIRRRSVVMPMTAGIGTAAVVWITATLGLTVLESPRRDLPAVAVFRLDGTTTSLEQFQGKPLVVNLWATWCSPCVREMPVLQHAVAARPDVHLVFLNQGEAPQKVLAFATKHQIARPGLLLDPSMEAGRLLGGAGVADQPVLRPGRPTGGRAGGGTVDRHPYAVSRADHAITADLQSAGYDKVAE